MKRTIKRFLCAALSILLVLSCACSTEKAQTVIEYKVDGKTQGALDTGFMYFWISFQKNMYSSVAQSYEDGWEHIVDSEQGTNLYDLLLTESLESAKKLLAIEYMHDKEYKLVLSDEEKEQIDLYIESYISAYGSKTVLNSELSKYGADTNTLRRYFELMLKQNALLDHLYGENGADLPEENQLKEFFANNYVIADHIFFSIAGGTKEDGTVVSLSDEEIEKKRELAREVYNRVTVLEEDFDTLKAQYSEDVFASEYYPHGFFVTNNSVFPAEFTGAVMALSEGEITLTETQQTGIHVVKKLPMDENLYNAYEDVYAQLVSAVSSEKFTNLITDKAQNAFVNESLMANYDAKIIPAFTLG